YVTATNANGTSIGNYVTVSLGQSSAPSGCGQACTDANSFGFTNLVFDESSMNLATFDTTDSGLPGFHWYGNSPNFSGQFTVCDAGNIVSGNAVRPNGFFVTMLIFRRSSINHPRIRRATT